MAAVDVALSPGPEDLPLEAPPANVFGNITVTDNRVTDEQLVTALGFNAILGAICFVGFCFLQRSAFPRHYRHRLVSPSVTVKPRPLPTRGWSSLWQWLINAIVTPEKEILSSAGLDAVVMTWCLRIGISLFLPMAVIGCVLLVPLHYAAYKGNTALQQEENLNRSQLMQLTIAAVPVRSPLCWLHFVLVVLYNVYAMCVLFWHFRQYVIIRHSYLTRGDDPNYWMALTHQADAKTISKKVKRMLMDLNLESEAGGTGGPPGGSGAPPPRVPSADQAAASLLSSFARVTDGGGGARPPSVMSSLRGLGAGLTRLFTSASALGSRAPSLTPPPTDTLPTLAATSLSAPRRCRRRGGICAGARSGAGAAPPLPRGPHAHHHRGKPRHADGPPGQPGPARRRGVVQRRRGGGGPRRSRRRAGCGGAGRALAFAAAAATAASAGSQRGRSCGCSCRICRGCRVGSGGRS